MEDEIKEPTSEKYREISKQIDLFLALRSYQTFDLDKVCKHFNWKDPNQRNYASMKLYYLTIDQKRKKAVLEKTGNIYRYIDRTIKNINWNTASEAERLDIKFPYGIEDNSKFGFDGSLIVSPKDVFIIAGVSNTGKTAFCLNFLWENMDSFPCTLMGNEYQASKFKRRVSRMTWKNPLKEDGTPKFELIERYDNWKDIIRPDSINIIDWLSVASAEFYGIGNIIEGIQSKLNKGIALISIQKAPGKDLGEGGQFSWRLCSLYLAMDFNRITVKKAKEWNGHDPNNEMYGFKIVNGGTQFHEICQIEKCRLCKGTGEYKGLKCERCIGTGYCPCEENVEF